MERHFQRDLELLKSNVIKMGSLVERNLADALDAVLRNDAVLASKVISADGAVNKFEIEIDNGVVDLLALQQPVASDLRLILAIQKINNDLERIGDHAVNIAESAYRLVETPQDEPLLEIPNMAKIATEMFQQALDAFIHLNAQLAQSVLESATCRPRPRRPAGPGTRPRASMHPRPSLRWCRHRASATRAGGPSGSTSTASAASRATWRS